MGVPTPPDTLTRPYDFCPRYDVVSNLFTNFYTPFTEQSLTECITMRKITPADWLVGKSIDSLEVRV